MNLSETAANIRPRNPYEAMDLGASMVRQWWKELWLIWFAVSLPFVVVIWFVLYDYRAFTVLALWWCKPLWETPLLHFIAEKLFNGDVTAQAIIKKTPQLLRHDLPLKITLRRFSITRSFDMPVSELERLEGTARNKRLNVLHRTSSSAAIWLTVVGTHLESLMVIAGFSLIWLFIPEEMALDMDFFDFFLAEDYELLRFILAYGAISAIGPFYVASGFCLYINRRTILEGWDIELRFKQLMTRVAAAGKGTMAVLITAAGLSFIGLGLTPSPALANYVVKDAEPYREYTPTDSRNDIIHIMEGDDFNKIENEEVLLPKDREFEIEEPETESEFLKSLFEFFRFVAQSIEVILWGLVIALVVFLLIRLNQYRLTQLRKAGKTPPPKTPDTLFGLDIRKESLPDNILDAAQQLWQQSQFREAYSLLYRGALAHIAHEKQVPLHESFTEEECVAQFHEYDDSLQPLFFAQLTQQWQMVAYGHQVPDSSLFETTCDGWHFHFQAGGDNE